MSADALSAAPLRYLAQTRQARVRQLVREEECGMRDEVDSSHLPARKSKVLYLQRWDLKVLDYVCDYRYRL